MGYCCNVLRVWLMLLCVLPVAANAATTSGIPVGEMARIVAGLQPAPAGFAPEAKALFPAFAHDVSAQWDSYREKIGVLMANWACNEIESTPGETIFYPFSGPDLSSVNQFYPQAGRYIMVAMQRAGLPPSLDRQPVAELKRTLSAYRARWRFFARTGFFRTNDLDDFASRNEVTVSVTSQLMAFAVRLGYDVEAVEPVQISADGKDLVRVTENVNDLGAWNSVRLTLLKNGHRVILDYVRIDLSDSQLNKYPATRAFVEKARQHLGRTGLARWILGSSALERESDGNERHDERIAGARSCSELLHWCGERCRYLDDWFFSGGGYERHQYPDYRA